MRDTVYLLDAYSLIYRSYFAFIRSPLRNASGENVSAVFGFFRSLFGFLRQYRPQYFIAVMDSETPTFRHDKYPDYKITRDKTPEDLTAQIPVIERILQALEIPMLRVNGYEADDIIATIGMRCRDEGAECRVISGDKDLLQLVDGPLKVLKPERDGFAELGRDEVYSAWGVYPEQVLSYLSLVGDSSDNVPGVAGIGAKTAAALLQRFPDLDSIYSSLDEISSASQRKKLEAGHDDAYLSYDLITLECDVPLDFTWEAYRLGDLNYTAAIPLFHEHGMSSIVKELEQASGSSDRAARGGPDPDSSADAGAAAGAGAHAGTSTQEAAAASAAGVVGEVPAELIGAGEYVTVDTLSALDDWVERCREAGAFAFDCETDGLDPLTAQPIGFSLASAPRNGCYIPLFGPEGEVLAEEPVRERLKALLEDDELAVVGQNLKYDYQVLKRWGIAIARPAFDAMIAAWVLDAGASGYGMDRLAEQYLGYTTIRYTDLVPKPARGEAAKTLREIAIADVTRYAAEDADIPLRLREVMRPKLRERRLTGVFEELEMPLVRLLSEMECAGIGLDTEQLASYSGELATELETIEEEIFRLCGKRFNIASTKQLQEVLFEDRKLQPVRKTKTGYSTDTAVLQELAREDPVPDKILKHRQLSKLKSTYVDALPRLVNSETGRLHTQFQQTGTATGRLSSRDPNLQNIPIRDEEGRRIRSAFIAAPGCVFVSADYAQIELVILAHLSQDPGLLEAFREGTDVHRRTGSQLFGVSDDEVTAEQRRIAKTINFGVMYGMSAYRLAGDLGIPRRDAEQFIQTYFRRYSGIRSFIDRTVAEAEEHGAVRTLFGRERRVPDINNRNRTVKSGAERVAVNTPIQGSAADIVKRAMLAVDARLRRENLEARLLLQVHDELILEAPEAEREAVTAILNEEMPAAAELSVPLRVKVEVGRSWGELH